MDNMIIKSVKEIFRNIKVRLTRKKKNKTKNRVEYKEIVNCVSDYVTDYFPIDFISEVNLRQYNLVRHNIITSITLELREAYKACKYINRDELYDACVPFNSMIMENIYKIDRIYILCNESVCGVKIASSKKEIIKYLYKYFPNGDIEELDLIADIVISMYINGIGDSFKNIVKEYEFEIKVIYGRNLNTTKIYKFN